MKYLLLTIFSFFLITLSPEAQSQPARDSLVLSNLQVQADDPLYTTYAAHMQRSEFTLDEGYHFRFYEEQKPVAFTTDAGIDLMLVFEKEGKVVYRPIDMDKKPTITSSFTDLVSYHFQPYPDIRVEATFQTYSSKQALIDVTVTNRASEPAQLEVHAVLTNHSRTFRKVRYHSGARAVSFTHQQLPDGWMMAKGVPILSKIQNVWLASEEPSQMSSYYRFDRGDYRLPQQVDMQQKPQLRVRGEVKHDNQEECEHRFPEASMVAYFDQNRDTILTQRAVRRGEPGQNIPGNGNYELELASLNQAVAGDRYHLSYFCEATGSKAAISGEVKDLSVDSTREADITLSEKLNLEQPKDVKVEPLDSAPNQVRLQWEGAKNSVASGYAVYRRDYSGEGVYVKVKEVKNKLSTVVKEEKKNTVYGYVVLKVAEEGQRLGPPGKEVFSVPRSAFLASFKEKGNEVEDSVTDYSKTISLTHTLRLDAGERDNIRWVRSVSRTGLSRADLIDRARRALAVELDAQKAYNRQLFSNVPSISFGDRETQLLYWSSFNMMRQVMLPPEGQLNHNYYVFSREPTWGWGHGGQVFHESLTMLAYGFMDPESAMNSQRVYRDVQHEDGYINYRTGSFLAEQIPVDGQKTTSAPWYAWQNWMLYKMTGDRDFLSDMYASSKRFYEYYTSTRDSDGDGLLEWGGHAVLESVRDALVAVWDEVDWPTNFEAMDLNTMIVSEEKALARMAEELGKPGEAKKFRKAARQRTEKINTLMWDSASGFYYHVDKEDHDFTYNEKHDLKRREIIGFLPLWAGVAGDKQAKRLVEEHLTNPDEFWRKYGIPSLSADDPYYDPQGYWNGPVWVEWNYLIEYGLLKYGYQEEAKELVDRVASNMINRLREDHDLWEFYSPDSSWGGYHRTYIWAGLINRMLIDVYSDPEKHYRSRR